MDSEIRKLIEHHIELLVIADDEVQRLTGSLQILDPSGEIISSVLRERGLSLTQLFGIAELHKHIELGTGREDSDQSVEELPGEEVQDARSSKVIGKERQIKALMYATEHEGQWWTTETLRTEVLPDVSNITTLSNMLKVLHDRGFLERKKVKDQGRFKYYYTLDKAPVNIERIKQYVGANN